MRKAHGQKNAERGYPLLTPFFPLERVPDTFPGTFPREML
jgi:hypothetical protein